MHDKSQLPDLKLLAQSDGRPLVAGLGGSTRHESRTLEALRVALEGAQGAGAAIMLLDIHQLDLPMFDAEAPNYEIDSVRVMLEVVKSARGLVVASPIYMETVSGALKNALDYLGILELDEPPGLSGKAIGRISVARGNAAPGASLMVEIACRGLGGWVLPDQVDLGGGSFGEDHHLCDVVARDRLLTLGRRVTAAAIARRAAEPVAAATPA
jgi:NAD(P)H-dependent FMN reductase